MPELPDHVPSLLKRARALLGLGGGPPTALGRDELRPAALAVEALHRGLVGGRELARPKTYDDPAHLGAYLLWWWPQTYAKVSSALRLAPCLPRPARILDVGAGPAPAALSILDVLGGEAVAIDASEAALSEARALAGSASLRTMRCEAASARSAGGEFEIVVLANVLSEIPEARREALLDALPLCSGALFLNAPD